MCTAKVRGGLSALSNRSRIYCSGNEIDIYYHTNIRVLVTYKFESTINLLCRTLIGTLVRPHERTDLHEVILVL